MFCGLMGNKNIKKQFKHIFIFLKTLPKLKGPFVGLELSNLEHWLRVLIVSENLIN